MHHPIPERLSQTLSIFQTVPRHHHCLSNTPISRNTSLNISSALLLVYYTLPKQQKFANMCKYCGPCLVIIFLLFFLFLKAVFKALAVLLVFIPLYCCIPLHGGRGREFCGTSFIETLILFIKALFS